MHTAQPLGCRRWNRLSTPTSTPNVDDSVEGEQELWRELLRKLEEVQLNLEDLPTREEPIWGMLKELGFTSYVERCKLCKQIYASKASPTKQ